MNRRLRISVGIALAIAWSVGGCGSKQEESEPAGQAAETAGAAALAEHVSVSAEVMTDATIKVAPVTIEALPPTIELTGDVAVDPDRVAQVPARVTGLIREVRFTEGAHVDAGAVLAIIESSEVGKLKASLHANQTRARAAQQRVTRLAELAKQGLASVQDLEMVRADAAALEADSQAARQTLAGFGSGASRGGSTLLQIRAPIGGFVMRRDAVRGQAVDDVHVLAEIADLDRAFFLGRVFEKDLAVVRVGATAAVRLKALPEQTFTGVVESVGRQVDPVARAVVARIAITNHDDLLKLGMFGTAELDVASGGDAAAPAMTVPLAAVVRIGERDVIFVQVGAGQAGGEFDVVAVHVLRRTRAKAVLAPGVDPKAVVAVAGVFTLKSVFLKATFGEED